MSYANPQPGEREAYIEKYMARRKAEGFNRRLPRFNGKGRGRAPTGTISPHSSLRKLAKDSWKKKINKAKKSIDKV